MSNKRKPITWFTSDIHHTHKNIVEFTDRSDVTTQEHHTEFLIDTWNAQVQKQDKVYHLGDFSFCTKQGEVEDFTRSLNGQKFFIKGNHDREAMFNVLKQNYLIVDWWHYKEIKIAGVPTCLFHFPIGSWHKQHYGSFNLHGHSHGSYAPVGKQLDVGLDNSIKVLGEYRLFSEEDVLEFMLKREVQINDHHKLKVTNDNP